jgi:adenylyltransferase/sulfurtransferase
MAFAITPGELKVRLDNGNKVILLDVRDPWEHQLARIEGSILIPLATLPQSLSKLDRNAEIVAYCHHGMRSADATSFLLQQGFSNAKNLTGGIDAWSIQVDPAVARY